MELEDIDDTFDSFILHSKTPQELMMKLMLSGNPVGSLDECVDFLIKRIFNGKVYDEDKKEKEFEDAVFEILSNIKKDELVNKYLISKSAYGAIIIDLLDWMQTKMSFWSVGFISESPNLNKVIGISKIMMKFDKEFIPSLRDKDGNNMMMIFAKCLNFDGVMSLVHRAGVSSSNSSFDEYVNNRYGCAFFRMFIVDMRCDPFVKNNRGECFADYFSESFLYGDLGYAKFNLTENKKTV